MRRTKPAIVEYTAATVAAFIGAAMGLQQLALAADIPRPLHAALWFLISASAVIAVRARLADEKRRDAQLRAERREKDEMRATLSDMRKALRVLSEAEQERSALKASGVPDTDARVRELDGVVHKTIAPWAGWAHDSWSGWGAIMAQDQHRRRGNAAVLDAITKQQSADKS